ncbi:hypothetical protein BN2497_4143 [Janthinobacterium sp. CG23_2]|nr:hypothetical protein BN2497_4143 [Janthinobacterium sp. CG23_2]CUU28469.1 hypothetical protein BN3177_4143 [Janthinobacterium sp. CG23_2]
MTIRLLCAHDIYPANAVVTLNAGTEAGLIASKQASATLTGGVPYIAPQPLSKGGKMVLAGDSISNQNNQVSATFNATLAKGYFTQAAAMLGQRFEAVRNAGVSGNTTADLLARLQTDVLAQQPEWCFMHIGTNDVGGDVPSSVTTANIEELCRRMTGAGIKLILSTIMPRGFAGMTQARLATMMANNAFIQAYAVRNSIPLVDLYRYMLDYSDITTTSQGEPVATWFDGAKLHPLAAGAVQMGYAIARQLDAIIPKLPRRLQLNYNGVNGDAANLIRNGMFAPGAAGTLGLNASGTVAQNWTAAAAGGAISGACSIVPRSASFNDNTPGNVQRVALTGAGASTEIFRLTPTIATPTVGDLVYLEVEILATASVGTIAEISLSWGTVGGTVISCAANYMASAAETLAIGTVPYLVVLKTEAMVIPVGTLGVYGSINIRTSTGAVAQVDAATARLSRVTQ